MAELTTEEIAAAAREAQEIFNDLKANQPRPVLLWLASYLRRWDLTGPVAVGMTTPEEELSVN